ncbi:MAG: hypothetical protein U9N10_00225 [Bacillota bacterium]|nr:hypothetical protein [Bacillota bacterium]
MLMKRSWKVMKKITILFLSMVLLCVGCTTNKNTAVEESELAETHIGSAVLKEPVRGVNNNIYIDSGIIQTTEYKPFAKKMVVYGITFVAKDDVSDEFMLKIAKTMKEMFIQNESTDQNLQEKVLKNLYKYNALIPVFKGEFDLGSSEEEIKLFSKVEKENSICDIIMEGSGYQTLEVVEHILHTVTDVGLHYTLTDQWGITNKSMIYKSMQEAIEKNIIAYLDMSSYLKGVQRIVY